MLMLGMMVNGCATMRLWEHSKTSGALVGCTATSPDYPGDAISSQKESIHINNFYYKDSKLKFLGMQFIDDDGALLVEVPEGYFPILNEIFYTPVNMKIESITAYTLYRRTLDNKRSDHFALDIIFSSAVRLKSYKKLKSSYRPNRRREKNGSICYSFGTYRGGTPFPNRTNIVILKNYEFSLPEWTPLPLHENQQIALNKYNTVQKLNYLKPLPERIILTPFAIAIDVVTFPFQLLYLYGGGLSH